MQLADRRVGEGVGERLRSGGLDHGVARGLLLVTGPRVQAGGVELVQTGAVACRKRRSAVEVDAQQAMRRKHAHLA